MTEVEVLHTPASIIDDDEFFDAVEFHHDHSSLSTRHAHDDEEDGLHIAFSRSHSVEMIRGGRQSPVVNARMSPSAASFVTSCSRPPLATIPPPPPPKETPLRFIRAGKGDPVVGRQRYEQTLQWRKENNMNEILKEPSPHFDLIKRHYPHFFHLRGKNGEYCYWEKPTHIDLKALRDGGVDIDALLRHYAYVTEFMWQYVDPDDFGKSIYVIDLKGIRVTDFAGECVDFVRKTSAFTGQHYPERCGYIFVINVPSWFKLIWNVVKPMVDEVTLEKIYILRGEKEIFEALSERIDIDCIPPEYGGRSVPLGDAPEERLFWDLVSHNNAVAEGTCMCNGTDGEPPCRHCSFVPVRSY
jgi:hypothetical protein